MKPRGCAGQADALRQHGSAGARRGAARRGNRAARRMRMGTRQAEAAHCSKMWRQGSAPRAEKRRESRGGGRGRGLGARPRRNGRHRIVHLVLERVVGTAQQAQAPEVLDSVFVESLVAPSPAPGRHTAAPVIFHAECGRGPHILHIVNRRCTAGQVLLVAWRRRCGRNRGRIVGVRGGRGRGRLALGHVRNALDHQSAREVGVPGQVDPVPQGHLAAGL